MGLIVDSFAGGGGASTGIEMALGRPIDIAINHDPEALALHAANHPTTRHFVEDIWHVDPIEACCGEPVDVMWCSPDCRHHSKCKNGKPVDRHIRGLAWIAVKWARRVRPRVIFLENVEEFRKWGPTDKKGHPIKRLEGKTFWRFVNALQRIGYNVEWRELRACDYGAPTSRNRFYMIARCDGHPIVWPKPTHGTMRHPHRTAAECIDWSIPCKSIFGRSKPLAEKTLNRIAKGVMRYVILNPEPFVVPVSGEWAGAAIVKNNHGDKPCSGVNEPLHTVTTQGNRFALVAAFLAKHFGGVVGASIDNPLPTITTKDHNALVAAHIVRQFGRSVGSKVDEPLGCVTAGGGGKSLLAATHVVKLRGTNIGQKADAPLQTIAAQGTHFGEVCTFLTKYYGSGIGQPVDAPLGTVTTKDRFGVVTVTIGGEDYAIADIGMRMLKPKELFKAQGFDENYVIAPLFNGKPLTTEAQVRMCGNSVCPPVAEALVRANAAELYGEAAA